MAERNRPHIFLRQPAAAEAYRPPNPGRQSKHGWPIPNRAAHGSRLRESLEAAEAAGAFRRAAVSATVEGTIPGTYVTFQSFPDVPLAFEKLDPRQGRLHPELRAVQTTQDADGLETELATVFIPDGKLGYFLTRLEAYIASASNDRPSNQDLVDRISAIGLAKLESVWTDPIHDFPTGDRAVWWEIWLRRRDGHEIERLQTFVENAQLSIAQRTLGFADRIVALVRASPADLAGALDVLDDLAELRRPRTAAELLAGEPAADQSEWVDDLAGRTSPARRTSPAVCVVDTGVHQPHPLLRDSLHPDDSHACDPTWGTQDHEGHGTEMAGLALYGDLGEAAMSSEGIQLGHGLESVKLLPPRGANPPELWGALTATAASLVEIQAPSRARVFSVATTASNEASGDQLASRIDLGQPSSWSAAVDALAAGLTVEFGEQQMVYLDEDQEANRRLFLIAAGNINDFQDDFLDRCDIEPVEDPGQAWNAVSVGAYTDLSDIDPSELGYQDWTPVAERGDLSPYSRTSVAFSPRWPAKPDVLFEGGNVARSPAGDQYDWPDSYQRLTTKRPSTIDGRLLTLSRQTSAATAQASHAAASILAAYPSMWPETVRALLVHSARWTPAMTAHFGAASSKKQRDALRRRYGMGIPDVLRATRSAGDALTLVAENTIHPFDGSGRMREMHLHELPWPTDILRSLGEAPVELRVTLSYFIEPNPGNRGWVRRYSYASHGLRFEIRRPTESTDDFRKRVNARALAEDERRPDSDSDSAEWYFGSTYRSTGSIHTDIWTGTAADLAERSVVAVYPVTGWWKLQPRHDHSDRGARYALVVSIETPGQNVDIWTPVAQQVGVTVQVST